MMKIKLTVALSNFFINYRNGQCRRVPFPKDQGDCLRFCRRVAFAIISYIQRAILFSSREDLPAVPG